MARLAYFLPLLVLLASRCTDAPAVPGEVPIRLTVAEPPTGPVDPTFGDYWYQGQAEITSYALEQARYGELHQGEAVLIFVTEAFSHRKHVKLDRPEQAGGDRVDVLKLNFTKTFDTGIYPYSMMASIFTPIDRQRTPQTLKVTTTSQEWCGHTFTQFDRTRNGYRVQQYSYFEEEGDQDLTLEAAPLEDEIWTTLRLNPDDLPTGTFEMIPGTLYQRLSHYEWGVASAEAVLTPDEAQPGLMRYALTYPALNRTLTIRFKQAFPHEVESWEETQPSGFGPDAPLLTTRAVRKGRLITDYWTKNRVVDLALRDSLGLQ